MLCRKLKAWFLTACLLMATTAFVQAQRNHDERHDNDRGRPNYYGAMRDHVGKQGYEERYRRDEQQHHHNDGGIGPGYGALIGGAGGAALGAVFGGGLKGTLIGGAAGAGLGALGGKLAQGNNNDHHHH